MSAYTPPAGGAVPFNFTVAPYTPPAGGAVAFEFVVAPTLVQVEEGKTFRGVFRGVMRGAQ